MYNKGHCLLETPFVWTQQTVIVASLEHSSTARLFVTIRDNNRVTEDGEFCLDRQSDGDTNKRMMSVTDGELAVPGRDKLNEEIAHEPCFFTVLTQSVVYRVETWDGGDLRFVICKGVKRSLLCSWEDKLHVDE